MSIHFNQIQALVFESEVTKSNLSKKKIFISTTTRCYFNMNSNDINIQQNSMEASLNG